MAKLYNLARVNTATTGTGTIALGSAVGGYLTFAQAGVADGDVVAYGVSDGANSAVYVGTYTASGTTLTIDAVLRSTGAGNNTAISLSGFAQVFITAPAELFGSNPNILYNGAMEIDQANEGAAVTGSTAYSLDGWLQTWVQGGAGPATLTAVRDTTVPAGFFNSLKASLAAAYTGATQAGDFWQIRYAIEANELVDTGFGAAGAQTLSLSFWLRTSVNGTWGVSFRNAAANRSYVQNITTVANTWKFFSLQIPGDVTGTWVTSGAALGAYLTLTLASGSTFQGTAGSWQASNIVATSSQTQIWVNANATANLTGVKLEVGGASTPFKRLTFQQELERCQRYFEKSYAAGTAIGSAPGAGNCTISGAGATANMGQFTPYKVQKRATPTSTIYDGAGTAGKLSYFNGSWNSGGTVAANAMSQAGVYVQCNVAGSANDNYEFVADARF